MPTLTEIRTQYPQYKDMPDAALADALHKKLYSDMPREEFNQKIGFQAAEGPGLLKSFGVGAVEGLGGAGDIREMSKAAPAWLASKAGFEIPEEVNKYVRGGIDLGVKAVNPAFGFAPTSEETRGLAEKAVGPLPEPKTRGERFSHAVGSVAANPLSFAGPGSLAVKAGAGAAGALGSEAAGQLAEGTALETPARLVGGVVAGGGAGTLAAERNLTKLAAQLPTRENIKAAANAGYDMLKKSDVRISPDGTQALLADVRQSLHADNFRDYLAPSTYRAIEELGAGGSATIGDLDGVRRLLGRVPATNPTDREAARRAIDAIDQFMSNVPEHFVLSGNPANDAAILKHAQRNWALHKQIEQLEEASVVGQHRAGVSGSGANRINTARQEVRKILDSDKKSRGMSDAVKEKMEEIVMGTWATNTARQAGKFAPSGPVSATTSILGGLYDWGVGAGIAAGGFLSKHLGEYLTDRQIKQLEQLMRSESPIGKPIARDIAPRVQEQRAVPGASAARALVTNVDDFIDQPQQNPGDKALDQLRAPP